MREWISRTVETGQELWSRYSIYVMIPLSVSAFAVALYLMLHDVM